LSSTILDIGANCGVATVILAKQNPDAMIYALEPYWPTFCLLKENVQLNNLKNVTILNMAIGGNFSEKVELFVHPHWSGGNSTCTNREAFEGYFNCAAKSISSGCTSIDRLVMEYNIQEIELLKIDCEGAEYDALYDCKTLQLGKIRNMVGEFHDLRYNSRVRNTSSLLMDYCRGLVRNSLTVSTLTL
jgi:FkbM family methyltransferase